MALRRETLLAVAPVKTIGRRRAVEPGPYNETYFEHAYLALHSGISAVEGAILSVASGLRLS